MTQEIMIGIIVTVIVLSAVCAATGLIITVAALRDCTVL